MVAMVLCQYCGACGEMASEKDITSVRGRSARELGRSKPTEIARDRILIVCEGSKTEPHYFEGARINYRLTATDVEICGKECGSAPISVVNYALVKFNDNKGLYKHVFCVFDRDQHESYEEALALVHKYSKNGFHAIHSIPSFEFWLLLHFKHSRSAYVKKGKKSPGDVVLGDLNLLFTQNIGTAYVKGLENVFFVLLTRVEDAVKRSRLCINDAEITNEPNPTTYVHDLINVLRKSAIPPLDEY